MDTKIRATAEYHLKGQQPGRRGVSGVIRWCVRALTHECGRHWPDLRVTGARGNAYRGPYTRRTDARVPLDLETQSSPL